MIVSKIVTHNFIYYDLHCEEVVSSNFSYENIYSVSQGIYIDRLQTSTLKTVIEDILSGNPAGIKKIILSFKYINAIQQNLNQTLNILITKQYKVLLTNIQEHVVEDLGYREIQNSSSIYYTKTYNDNITKIQVTKNIYNKFYLFEDDDNFIEENFSDKILFDHEFTFKIKQYIESENSPHTSSFVYLTSFVDIKKFISYEKKLILFSIYLLAQKINNEWKTDIDKNPILVCQSLNSSYIVSILSNLLKLDILILDKIGPINKLYNRLDKNISQTRKYIVVSDMVCLGTEVKIVKNLIEFIGGKYLGNVSLIKTETLKKSDIMKKDATIAIFAIDKSNNKDLNFYITTELEVPYE
jgi:hypothetical protein